MDIWFERMTSLENEQESEQFVKEIQEQGFMALNNLINSFYEKIKEMEDKEFKQVEIWIQLGKDLLPDLATFSPTWSNTWKNLQTIFERKVEFYSQVPLAEREGEWQVLFDNPFITDDIVCNSNLKFAEATYLIAKYLLNLKKSEIVKLQKVITYAKTTGM